MSQNVFNSNARQAALRQDDYRTIMEVRTYQDAEKVIETLSHSNFPIQHTRIVGINLESVEQVLGRYSKMRAVRAGVTSMLFWTVMVLMFSWIIIPQLTVETVGLACAMGAMFGVFNGISNYNRVGRRGYATINGLQANSYEVQVRSAEVNPAYHLLAQNGYRFSENS